MPKSAEKQHEEWGPGPTVSFCQVWFGLVWGFEALTFEEWEATPEHQATNLSYQLQKLRRLQTSRSNLLLGEFSSIVQCTYFRLRFGSNLFWVRDPADT